MNRNFTNNYAQPINNFYHTPINHIYENYQAPPTHVSSHIHTTTPTIKYDTVEYTSTSSPLVFGPPLWFSLHNAAAHYVDNPSPITRDRMKNVILGLPILLPCQNCREHATAYIEKNYDNLDDVVSCRDKLFKFFVDFHNYVNQRYNKKIFTYEEAYKMYLGGAKVSKMTFS
jgi:hypothetical protein